MSTTEPGTILPDSPGLGVSSWANQSLAASTNQQAQDTQAAADDAASSAPTAAPVDVEKAGKAAAKQFADNALKYGPAYAHQVGDAAARIISVAPWAKQQPDFVLQMAHDAARGGNINSMLEDLSDTNALLQAMRYRDSLEASSTSVQESTFQALPRAVQQTLGHVGYQPPSVRPDQGGGGVLGFLKHAADSAVNDLDPKLGGLPTLRELGSKVLSSPTQKGFGLGDISNVVGTVARIGHVDSSQWGFGSFTQGPAHFLKSWKMAWRGDRLFDPKVSSQVQETFDDEENFQFVRQLASGQSIFDIAATIVDPADPKNAQAKDPAGYAAAVQRMDDFTQNDLVKDGIAKLQGAKLSFGRDVATTAGLKPGSSFSIGLAKITPYQIVSGAADATTQFIDPTLVAGKALKGFELLRFGLNGAAELGDAALASRVSSFYHAGEELDSIAAARDVTKIGEPGYTQALAGLSGITPQERASVMIHDAVREGDYAALYQQVHDYGFVNTISDYVKHTPIDKPTDVEKFFTSNIGLQSLVQGDLRNYKYEFMALPKLTRAATYQMGAKVAFGDAIDFMANPGPILKAPLESTDIAQGSMAALQRSTSALAGDSLARGTQMILSPMARAFQRVTTLVPATNVLRFDDPKSVEIFDQMLGYGARGPESKALFNQFINATTESEKRATVQSAMQSMFANAGLFDAADSGSSEFLNRWLRQTQQSYGLYGIDAGAVDGGRAAIDPFVDVSNAMQIPSWKEVVAETRRVRTQQMLSGFGGTGFYDKAMKIWRPVETTVENYARLWRATVLGAPVKAGFGVRMGASEGLVTYGRFGFANTVKQLLLPRIEEAAPELAGADLGAGNRIFGLLPDGLRRSARSQAAKGVAAVTHGLERITGTELVDEATRRAMMDPAFIDTVGKAKAEIVSDGWAREGFREPDAFLTVPTVDGGSIDFSAVPGHYQEYRQPQVLADGTQIGDPYYQHLLAKQAEHVNASPLHRLRAQVRSVFMEEPQAQRIAGTVGLDLPSMDAFDQVAAIRSQLADLPVALRKNLMDYADTSDKATLDGVTAAVTDRQGIDQSTVQIVKAMEALPRSDRYAVLADPAKALAGIDPALHGDDWSSLLTAAQHGDGQAAAELESKVLITRASQPDMAGPLDRLDRFGSRFGVTAGPESPEADAARAKITEAQAELAHQTPDTAEAAYAQARLTSAQQDLRIISSGRTRDEAMRDWEAVHRAQFDEVALDSHGQVIHGTTVPMANDTFNSMPHVMQADWALPSSVHGPQLQPIKGKNLAERWINGYFDWTGEIVKGMARQPLWQKLYADRYRVIDPVVGSFFRKPELTADIADLVGSGRVGRLSDALLEMDARLEEGHRAAGGIRSVAQAAPGDLADVLATRGFNIDPADIGRVKTWWASEANAREAVGHATAVAATRDAIPFIHSSEIRSQAADSGRLVAPFWFATEQFYKRWARTFVQSPEAMRRVQLVHQALNATGWLDHDSQGREVFHYPGAEWTDNTIAKFFNAMPGSSKWTLPVQAALTGQLMSIDPGIESSGSWPSVGPLVTVPMSIFRRLSPELGGQTEQAISGQSAGQSYLDLILPTNFKRLYDLTLGWDDGSHAASSVIAAMQLMDASGHGLPESTTDADGTVHATTAADKQVYLDRLVNHARVAMITRDLFGLMGPASPTTDYDTGRTSKELTDLLAAGLPIGDAMTRFLRDNPDANAFTVFDHDSPSKAPAQPTDSALQSLSDNAAFFAKYKESGAWFLPQTPPTGATDSFSIAAWRAMLADGVRVQKTPDAMWRDIKYAEAAPTYFDMKAKKDALLDQYAGDAASKATVNDNWRQWSADYLNTHPVFAEDYASPVNSQTRDRIRKETAEALADPDAPVVPQAAGMSEMLSLYDRMNTLIADSMKDRSDAGITTRNTIRQNFANWAEAKAAADPTLEAFYLRIIRPDLQLSST